MYIFSLWWNSNTLSICSTTLSIYYIITKIFKNSNSWFPGMIWKTALYQEYIRELKITVVWSLYSCICVLDSPTLQISPITLARDNTGWPLSRQCEIPWQFPDGSRHFSAALGMLSVTHIMPVLVLNTRMDANMHLTVGWLVLNGTFSTKSLYRAMRKVKVC